uniref:Uncharacterized protein n=1 Tax=Fagus sylvatica TaxID=28930 RepID=A0A2N9GI14_FAGSY
MEEDIENARIYQGHVKSDEDVVQSIKWDVKERIEFCKSVKKSVRNRVLCFNWGAVASFRH